MSNATANEQLMLELINRARMDPSGEAARYGIDLNQGLGAGTISSTPKQPLAMNNLLIASARTHSQWMIDTDTFSHTGAGGSSPGDRMSAAGYSFTGSWTWGENISWRGSTGSINLTSMIIAQHQDLFLSPGHRENIMNGTFREVGVGQISGVFTGYNASMVTQNFAKSGTAFFLLGVAYNDTNNDSFYTVGEARASVQMSAQLVGGGTTSATGGTAGGYELGVSSGTYNVTFSGGGLAQAMTVRVALSQNVKLDVVNGDMIFSSESLTLVSGVTRAKLLGAANINLTGSGAADVLTGNAGVNTIDSGAGNDTITGGKGNDALNGGDGSDTAVFAGARSSYTITSTPSGFTVSGGDGTDTLTGVEFAQFTDQTVTLGGASPPPPPPPPPGTLAKISDFNGDGKGDILWQTDGHRAAIWNLSGTNLTFGDLAGPQVASDWQIRGAGDFNGDGKRDVLWETGGNRAAIWIMNNTVVSFGDLAGPQVAADWNIVGTGDFNADGRSDILWETGSNRAAIWLMNGTQVTFGDLAGPQVSPSWNIVGTGDFNGDGKSDILWETGTGRAAIWLMNGAGVAFGDLAGPQVPSGWRVKGVGDFDGDGKSDLVWETGTGRAAIWLMNGTGVKYGDLVGPQVASDWHVKGAIDADGNGKSDILWQTDSGRAAVWLMNGTTLLGGDFVGPNPGTTWHVVSPTG